MKISKKDLVEIINNVITESAVNETVFEIDPNDSEMQQKIAKIKGDSSLYDDNEDEIKIAGEVNESIYKKSDILKLIAEGKKNKNDDYLKAIKKTDRELEYDLTGPGWKSKDKTHKNKTKYFRKTDKKGYLNDCVNEEVLSKKDIVNIILEKKYNGKVYSKYNLMKEINEEDNDFILNNDNVKKHTWTSHGQEYSFKYHLDYDAFRRLYTANLLGGEFDNTYGEGESEEGAVRSLKLRLIQLRNKIAKDAKENKKTI